MDSIVPTAGASDFQKFAELSLELKYEIFDLLLPGPRILEIVERRVAEAGSQTAANHLNMVRSSVGCFNAPLILLSISHESREFFLKKYHQVFENVLLNPVYINFNIDVLTFLSVPVWMTFSTMARMTGDNQIEFDRIKSLVLPAPTPTYNSRALVNLAIQTNAEFTSLKQLFVAEPPMYWALVPSTAPVTLGKANIKDLVTLHRQIAFRGVDRGKKWEASEVEIVTEGALKLKYQG
ncbi:uncharacterized protein RSE6_04099 [Rhynchosporium secalis]|uniref:2EXR domain-containing protein n=1 Tax=Rhynchosporium secalis TaxID=38038 RepID=A0A1E1M4E6_RHYSE|nr:uncharacterized protein RSE6_04099 [Rhynchosporium secalis]